MASRELPNVSSAIGSPRGPGCRRGGLSRTWLWFGLALSDPGTRPSPNTAAKFSGIRPLDLDGIELPALHSAWGLGGKLLHGADAVRNTREDEWGTRPTLVYWSYGYIEMLGEELAAARF